MITNFRAPSDILAALYATTLAVYLTDTLPTLASRLDAQGEEIRRQGMGIIAEQIGVVSTAARSVAGDGLWSRAELLHEIEIAQIMLLAASDVVDSLRSDS